MGAKPKVRCSAGWQHPLRHQAAGKGPHPTRNGFLSRRREGVHGHDNRRHAEQVLVVLSQSAGGLIGRCTRKGPARRVPAGLKIGPRHECLVDPPGETRSRLPRWWPLRVSDPATNERAEHEAGADPHHGLAGTGGGIRSGLG
jgi:hypothetical protein